MDAALGVGVIQLGLILRDPQAQVRLLASGPKPPDAAAGTFAALAAASLSAMPRLYGQPSTQATGGAGPQATAGHGGAVAKLGAPGGLMAAELSQYLGRSAGSGQCVALVQSANPGIGPTRTWRCGAPVQGNMELRPGTAIATFNSADRYANAMDGSSHAAIYLGQNERGIQVMDQWAGSAAAVRTIPWSNPSGVAANTGTAFHVVRPVS